jgi:deoxyribodipyrimidine photo-lyase
MSSNVQTNVVVQEKVLPVEVIVWLVRDTLRLYDNPSLVLACNQAMQRGAALIPLVCLEPRRWADQQFGLPRIGPHWTRFRVESVQALQADLEARGGSLWLFADEPNRAVNAIHEMYRIDIIVTDSPLSNEERLENAKLESEGFSVLEAESGELFSEAQLPFARDELPASFSRFRKLLEKKPALLPGIPVDVPALPHIPACLQPLPAEWLEAQALRMPKVCEVSTCGGETNAQIHWQAYLEAQALSHYKATRNAFQGAMNSSHLSAWLAHGCLSPRQVWADTLRYEVEVVANESTYWLRFELLWREYFRWYARATDWTLFRRAGPKNHKIAGDDSETRFRAWRKGQTGCDIVDAAMRELSATGWMSNRARQLVASHLVYESRLDWRLGAAWFESQLIDYDVGSNWGNWAYIAGVGADPRGGRIFNLDAQADRYDADGLYRAKWISA